MTLVIAREAAKGLIAKIIKMFAKINESLQTLFKSNFISLQTILKKMISIMFARIQFGNGISAQCHRAPTDRYILQCNSGLLRVSASTAALRLSMYCTMSGGGHRSMGCCASSHECERFLDPILFCERPRRIAPCISQISGAGARL